MDGFSSKGLFVKINVKIGFDKNILKEKNLRILFYLFFLISIINKKKDKERIWDIPLILKVALLLIKSLL